MLPKLRLHVREVVGRLALSETSRIVVVGAAFGWEIEVLRELLPGVAVVGTDTSPWIHATGGQSETTEIRAALVAAGLDAAAGQGREIALAVDDGGPRMRESVLDEDLASGASRSRVLAEIGGTCDWAISSHVLTWLDDAEAVTLSSRMGRLGGQVAHVVRPFSTEKAAEAGEPPPVWNWKTGAAWKALLPKDTIITDSPWGTF